MGRKRLSNSEKIRRYMTLHPDAKPKAVAEALGVKPNLVYGVKYKEANKVSPPKIVRIDTDELYKNAKVDAKKWMPPPLLPMPKADMVNHPPHYKEGGIETIDFIQAKLTREEYIGYLKGNALKYGSRIGKKDNADIDAGKMAWYAARLRDALVAS